MTHDVQIGICLNQDQVIKEIRRFTDEEIIVYQIEGTSYDLEETYNNKTRIDYEIHGKDDIRVLITHIPGRTKGDKLATQMIRLDFKGSKTTEVTCLDNFFPKNDTPAENTADFLKSLALTGTFTFKNVVDCNEILLTNKIMLKKFDTRHFVVDPLRGGKIDLIGKNHFKDTFSKIVSLQDADGRGYEFLANLTTL